MTVLPSGRGASDQSKCQSMDGDGSLYYLAQGWAGSKVNVDVDYRRMLIKAPGDGNADDQGLQEETFCRRPPRFSKGSVPRFVISRCRFAMLAR